MKLGRNLDEEDSDSEEEDDSEEGEIVKHVDRSFEMLFMVKKVQNVYTKRTMEYAWGSEMS
jgi:hypothetical protein